MNKKNFLITGSAGFIGFHLAQKLCTENWNVFGLDNLNDYYDVNLKKNRIDVLCKNKNFVFIKDDILHKENINNILKDNNIDIIIHLAAQAGVRMSIEEPQFYIDSNITGFLNILESAKNNNVSKIIYASSSSIYGNNKKLPFSEKDRTSNPLSIYGVTKKTNELMSNVYHHLYNINFVGLRFFTVYGPWGRPDMALFLFTESILKNKPINVFNNGNHTRSFTYVDDIINSIYLIIKNENSEKFNKIFNIGGTEPVNLMNYIKLIENHLNMKAKINFLPMQSGDVGNAEACSEKLNNHINYKPKTKVEDGIPKFIEWFRDYYKI